MGQGRKKKKDSYVTAKKISAKYLLLLPSPGLPWRSLNFIGVSEEKKKKKERTEEREREKRNGASLYECAC